MAYLTRRWPWGIVVAALAILVAYLPPQPPPEPDRLRDDWQSYPTPESRLAKRLGDDYARAAARAHITRLRDSLMRVLAARAARPGTVTGLSPGPALDSTVRAFTKAATPPLPSLSPDVRGALAMVWAGPATWEASSNAYLPSGTDGHTCIVSQAVDPNGQHQFGRPSEALGPCAFFMAFGLPGREIGHWLESRDYDLASMPDWTIGLHPRVPPGPPTVDLWLRAALGRLGGALPAGDPWASPPYPSIYWRSFSGAACAAGDRAACRRYLITDGHRSTSLPGMIRRRYNYWFSGDGMALASLVRDQGVERFARFWRSPLGPEAAFDQAFTVSFDQWAPLWARSQIGPVRIDVRTRAREVISSLLWVGVCIGACVRLAMTRRVV